MTPASPAARRYFRRAALCYLAYAVLTFGLASLSGAARTWPAWSAYVAALAGAAPVLAAVVATVRYLAAETSPIQRDIQIEALLWGVGVTFCVATAWGLLGQLFHGPQVSACFAFAVFGSVVGSVQLARRLFPRR